MLLLFVFISCASANDPLERDTFSFREPTQNDIAGKVILWATYYYLPQLGDSTGDFALRDMKGIELGPRVTLKEWCDSALEGSVRITDKYGGTKTYNYAGVSNHNIVDCQKIFKFDVSKTKFREAHGTYGDGIEDYILDPYRTLATDKSVITPGAVLYIPEAKGAKIILPNKRVIIHDGYFFAADIGGAIKNNHVDVFIGTSTTAPFFPWIKNNSTKTFEAFIVTDKKIILELADLHSDK